jgi:hypothetical protein
MSVYPTGIDSFTTKVDNVDDVLAADVNNLQSSVVAIQNTLGTNPALTVSLFSETLTLNNNTGTTQNITLSKTPVGPVQVLYLTQRLDTSPIVSAPLYSVTGPVSGKLYGVGNGSGGYKLVRYDGTLIIELHSGWMVSNPTQVAINADETKAYVAATGYRIYVIDLVSYGDAVTFAGTGSDGFSGDGGPATSAQLGQPHGVAVDSLGNVYIGDSTNYRVRKVDTNGNISTICGDGTATSTGDGGDAAAATTNYPAGLGLDADDNLYILEIGGVAVRKINSATNIISKVAGTYGSPGFSGDGGNAVDAQFNLASYSSILVNPDGSFYVADSFNQRIRFISTGGIIETAPYGNGSNSCIGGPTPTGNAILNLPLNITILPNDNTYIWNNNCGQLIEISGGLANAFSPTTTGLMTYTNVLSVPVNFPAPGPLTVSEIHLNPTSIYNLSQTAGGFNFNAVQPAHFHTSGTNLRLLFATDSAAAVLPYISSVHVTYPVQE